MANFSSNIIFPDVFSWIIKNLPQIPQFKTNSINLCPSSSSQPSLKLSIITNPNNSSFSLFIFADYNLLVPLWTSKKILLLDNNDNISNDVIPMLLTNFINDVLKYCPNYKSPSSLKLPTTIYSDQKNLKDIFNFSFLSLTFIVCIYEAPKDLRKTCLNILKDEFACPKARGVSKILMRFLGSNTEEQWMRCMNLAITNWIFSEDESRVFVNTLSPLFCYSFSTVGLWKVQLYCPVMAMNVEKSSGHSPDARLMFSLNHHQLEGVIQMNYRVDVQEKWIEVMVNTDNIRCDVIKLLTDTQMKRRGAGASEKHFPSRISLQITPTLQTNIISTSVSKSTDNPPREFGVQKGIEAAFDPPTALGLHVSASETVTTNLKPWKFEQSVYGNSANLNWFLHDYGDGREVFSSKPSKFALLHPRSWFKNRYSSAYRPFTRQGGVIFAGDEYGERVSWKVDRGGWGLGSGGNMQWDIRGWIWLTYWPNQRRTFYTETRRLEFREVVNVTLN